MKLLLASLAAILLPGISILAAAPSLPEEIAFREDGRFTVGGMTFEIGIMNPQWHGVANPKWREVKSRIDRSGATVKGVALIDGGKGNVSETVLPVSDRIFSLESSVEFDSPIKLNRISGTFSLPLGRSSVEIDGRRLAVPETFRDMKLYSGKPREIILRGYGAIELGITGMSEVLIQDNRKFKSDTVSVMFLFSPSAGTVSSASLKLGFELRHVAGRSVPLDAFANRAFRDEPGAPSPGWTAQGPEEDLLAFRPGRIAAQGVEFDVSPKGAVAVGGEKRGGVPREITVPVSVSGEVRSLNLLHTSAWTPHREFGEVEVRFSDGENRKYPVSGLRDCGNWVNPRGLGNAAVAWKGSRPDAEIGVYFSTFPLPAGKTPVAVTFRSLESSVIWLVLGMNFADRELFLPGEEECETRIQAGKEWVPLRFRNRTVAGSPLDFSARLDAPAGKYGFARPAADGTLRFDKAPARRLRLFGTNLCQSANFPSKESAELIADLIARNGYNSVRFHHHDGGLADPKAADSATLNPEALDRFDYLFATLKKRGIYLVTDFYTSRPLKEGDGISGNLSVPKALFPADPAALENWKKFVRNWMTHRNPYTGLTYAEDPALVMVNLVNEDNLDAFWNRTVADRDRYAALFEPWKKEHGCPEARADRSDRRFLEFLFELQNRSLAEMTRFAKEELHVQAAVTSMNHHSETYLVPSRARFDVVDNHLYHAHPSFLGKAWASQRMHAQTSVISAMASLPRSLMATRITGKPFFVTEFNYCNPNRFRAEGGPLIGGYAALQDWDGIYRFCYSHNIKRIETETIATGSFESVNEPLMQLSDRIIASLFLRGDAASAGEEFSYAVPENLLRTNRPLSFPIPFQVLGLIARIGSHVEGSPLPSGVVAVDEKSGFSAAGKLAPAWREAVEKRRAVSSTGELRLDADEETFVVKTPRSEAVSLPRGELATGGVLAVSGAKNFQTVAALSLDGKPLAESCDILLLHLTDVSNSDAVFADRERRIVNDQGKLPLLVRRDRVEVTLRLAPGTPFRVTALSADGDTLGEVPVKGNGFTTATDLFPGGVMAYRVTR